MFFSPLLLGQLREITLTGFDRIRYIVNGFTRMRYCNQAGLKLTEKLSASGEP
jgi:hypothetical protein